MRPRLFAAEILTATGGWDAVYALHEAAAIRRGNRHGRRRPIRRKASFTRPAAIRRGNHGESARERWVG